MGNAAVLSCLSEALRVLADVRAASGLAPLKIKGNGEILRKVPEDRIIEELMNEIDKL